MDPCADCAHDALHLKRAGCLATVDGHPCPCLVYVPPTPTVVSSPTLERARAERDAAVRQVAENADAAWMAQATDVVAALAASRAEFTTDHAWTMLDTRGVPAPREPRAMGPVIVAALRAGTIRPVGYTQSRRRHAAMIRTYVGSAA